LTDINFFILLFNNVLTDINDKHERYKLFG